MLETREIAGDGEAGRAKVKSTSRVRAPAPRLSKTREAAVEAPRKRPRREAGAPRQASDATSPRDSVPAASTPSVDDDGGRVGHATIDAQVPCADPAVILDIRMQWRRRQGWVEAQKKLTLQAKAFCRMIAEGDKAEAALIFAAATDKGDHPLADLARAAIEPLLNAIEAIEEPRRHVEKRLGALAKTLPVAPFVDATHGLSFLGLAAIVGEAGDLAIYANPGKLWKRMGLAPMAGQAIATRRGDGAMTTQDWLDAGYSPRRRSAMFVIGASLIGSFGNGPRPLVGEDVESTDWPPLQKLFVQRLRHEVERDPTMGRPITPAGKESFSAHAKMRAQRYVEKRLLRDLWRAWRGQDEVVYQ